MNNLTVFFQAIGYIGAGLVVISIVLIIMDIRKEESRFKEINDRVDQLKDVLKDAEEMMDQMNSLSELVVDQIDRKVKQLHQANSVEDLDRFKKEPKKANKANEVIEIGPAPVFEQIMEAKLQDSAEQNSLPDNLPINAEIKNANTNYNKKLNMFKENEKKIDSPPIVTANKENTPEPVKIDNAKQENLWNSLNLNNRYREVLRLSEEGMTDGDIAKKLKIGKGEVQMVLEMNKKDAYESN